MPAVTRELSIIYGATTVGGTTDRLLDFPVDVIEGADRGSLRFSFVTSAATEAAFDAEVAALEAAFRDVRLRLRVVQGAATLYDWDPAAGVNTGFNHLSRIDKVGEDPAHTGRSRKYSVTIEFDLPADVYDQSGRRLAHVVVDYTPARKRRLTITGEYTALGANNARAQYQANIGTYASTLTTGLGGTWELAEEEHDEDETDKILRFRRVYDQVISDQSSSGLGDTAIVRHSLAISVLRPRPGDSPAGSEVRRPLECSVRYSAWVDRDVSTDLENVYESRLRAWLVQRVEALADGAQAALVEEAPEYDAPENRVSVSMRLLVTEGGTLLEYRETAELDVDEGKARVPVWNGNRWAKYVYQGPATARYSSTITKRVVGQAQVRGGGGNVGLQAGRGPGRGGVGVQGALGALGIRIGVRGGGRGGDGASDARRTAEAELGWTEAGGSWILISSRASATPVRVGSTDHGWDATDITVVRVEEYVEDVVRGGGPITPPPPRAQIT